MTAAIGFSGALATAGLLLALAGGSPQTGPAPQSGDSTAVADVQATATLAEGTDAGASPASDTQESVSGIRLEPVRVEKPGAGPGGEAGAGWKQTLQPFMQKYCISCHGTDVQEAGLNLEKFGSFAEASASRQTWRKMIEFLNLGLMPPEDSDPMPAADETKAVIDAIETMFFRVDCEIVHDPGRVTIRRLNRSEYNNTIRDLVGVDFKPAADFPSDDVGYGFDNIGDVLSLPPLLMEKYLAAAEQITDAAILVGDPSQLTKQHRPAMELDATGGVGGAVGEGFRSINSVGAVFGEYEFRQPGRYVLRARVQADQAGPDKAKVAFLFDGKPVATHEVNEHLTPQEVETEIEIGGDTGRTTGKHQIDFRFLNDYYMPKAKNPKDRDRNISVAWVEVQGPLGVETPYPETHTRILFVTPGPELTATQAATKILTRFATRAWRRPVAAAEVNGIVQLVDQAIQDGESFEEAIQYGVQAVLVSPHFLFRVESTPIPDDPSRKHQIGSYELASRLSYFLWSSMPDDELFRLAEAGTLAEPEVLRKQVQRMLGDERARSLVKNFGGQWLNLRNLDEVTPNRTQFPVYNDELRDDMRRETEEFLADMVRNDGSLLDLLDARHTFLNERLAKLYGIDGVKGDEFRRVSLEGTQRAGVLTHASILTLTSDPTKTSPVKRGKWIMENILGTPPPPPPPNVPELAATEKANPKATLREQLALHRESPGCASCHKVMDPLGFGFENFDAIGRWRTEDRGHPIDSSGKLPGGEEFSGAVELTGVLRGREQQFSRHFTRALLTYALGRGLEYYDECAVDQLTESLRTNGHRFSVLVSEIVLSDPFLMRRGEGGSNR
ncbi:MAG: DUF1592 domain-containing protein [Planctomycetaceae bacterium]|nr:DUF1592 domain-containing protein [Planctomycetaceae bacterium]